MGFDASEVMRELDGQRILRESLQVPIVSNVLRQYQNSARNVSVIDQLQRSIQSSMVSPIGDIRPAVMTRARVYASLPSIRISDLTSLRASHVLRESVRRGLHGLSGNLAGVNYYARMQSDMLKQARMLGYVGLSSSIAQAFEAHGLDSASSAAWSLRCVQSVRTPALQSILKAATTFGPIAVSPDYEDAPFDYHPDLQGWLIPETATESGDAIDVEELWAVVVAFAQGIAVHHRTEVLLSLMGNGTRCLIRVCKHPAVTGTVAGTVGGAAGGIVSGDVVTGAVSGSVSGGVSALITYLLTRR